MECNDISMEEKGFWLNYEICSELMLISNSIRGWDFNDTEFFSIFEMVRKEMIPFLLIGDIANDQFRVYF